MQKKIPKAKTGHKNNASPAVSLDANASLDEPSSLSKPRRYIGPYNRRRGDVTLRPGQNTWLLSFTDIIALMLTFFVLLYAMSEPEQKIMSEIAMAFKEEVNQNYGPSLHSGPQDAINLGRINFNTALSLPYLETLLKSAAEDQLISDQIQFISKNDRLILSMPETILFNEGSVKLNDQARPFLYKLANSLGRIRNRIEVAGYMESEMSIPPDSSYPSSWELSMERTAEVAAILKRQGYRNSIDLRTYGNSGYIDETDRSFSRRVDIHVMRDDGRLNEDQRLNLE